MMLCVDDSDYDIGLTVCISGLESEAGRRLNGVIGT